ncbi:MAG TPA: ABC transporter substrate-binding protein [Cellvibrio sp.]
MKLPQGKFILVIALLATSWLASAADTPIELRLFAGGNTTRPDLLRTLLDDYEIRNPGVRIHISVGSATAELQRKYLTTLLNAKDSTYDAFILDITSPAQFAAAGWTEALNRYVGDTEELFAEYLPVYRQANWFGNQLVALPAYSDAMFMYYRKDLLERHGINPPETWDELASAASTILAAENDANLQGLSIQGAPIEGAVCTFLLPYWSQGSDVIDRNGLLTFDRQNATNGLQLWRDLMAKGVIKNNVAEIKTGDTLNDFKAGKAIFAINWGFAWDRFQRDKDSRVRDIIGVIRLPKVSDGEHASCIGGYQWAVSAFSRHKTETVALVRYLGSAEVSTYLALKGGLLPTRTSLYRDATLNAQIPWLPFAEPVVLTAKSRPVTPRYAEVSNAIRSTTSAVLGGSMSVPEGVSDIERRLTRILRSATTNVTTNATITGAAQP